MPVIPFNKPVFLEDGFEWATQLNQNSLAGDGRLSHACEAILSGTIAAPTRMTTSATHAIEMMGLLLDIRPGDEVILPSFTFVSTANPFALRGARLRFADNDEFGNILPSEIERLSSEKTKAVIAVHYAGASCDLENVLEICREKKISFVEDAAQAIEGSFKGRALGTFGRLGCLSFHDTKNITSGEGGALIVGDETLLERADIIREKGANRKQFLQGLVDKYSWVDIGSSYILSELNAAYLLPQLKEISKIQRRRREIFTVYQTQLSGDFEKAGARILQTPKNCSQNFHIFGAIFDDAERRNRFMRLMKESQVTCPFHYVPLHSSKMGMRYYEGSKPETLEGCDRFSRGLVRMPIFYNLTDEELAFVVSTAKKALSQL